MTKLTLDTLQSLRVAQPKEERCLIAMVNLPIRIYEGELNTGLSKTGRAASVGLEYARQRS
jgi:hypothetical protein